MGWRGDRPLWETQKSRRRFELKESIKTFVLNQVVQSWPLSTTTTTGLEVNSKKRRETVGNVPHYLSGHNLHRLRVEEYPVLRTKFSVRTALNSVSTLRM